MPTSFTAISSDLMRFAIGLLGAARVGTSAQVGRSSRLDGRSQPGRRAKEFLSSHPDVFEKIPGIQPYPIVWRLTRDYKRARGLTYRNVGASQRLPHWLAFGDLWIELVQHGLRPAKWFTEGKLIGGFDIYAEIAGRPYLIEMQVTDLSKREWRQKWYRRAEWFDAKPWMDKKWKQKFMPVPPRILLISPQKLSNVQIPRSGVLYIPEIEEVHHYLVRSERK